MILIPDSSVVIQNHCAVRRPATSFCFGHVWLARLLRQRGIAAVYLVAFLALLLEFKRLLAALEIALRTTGHPDVAIRLMQQMKLRLNFG